MVGPAFVAAVAAAVAIGGHAGPIADGADRVVVRHKAAAGTDPAVVRHSMMLSRAARVKRGSASLLLANMLLEEVAPEEFGQNKLSGGGCLLCSGADSGWAGPSLNDSRFYWRRAVAWSQQSQYFNIRGDQATLSIAALWPQTCSPPRAFGHS